MNRLSAEVDGIALGDEEARALWERFSAYMDAHKGDLGGFARAEGFVSVHPELRQGAVALVASRVAPQQVYGPAPRSRGGSNATHARDPGRGKRKRNNDKRRA